MWVSWAIDRPDHHQGPAAQRIIRRLPFTKWDSGCTGPVTAHVPEPLSGFFERVLCARRVPGKKLGHHRPALLCMASPSYYAIDALARLGVGRAPARARTGGCVVGMRVAVILCAFLNLCREGQLVVVTNRVLTLLPARSSSP